MSTISFISKNTNRLTENCFFLWWDRPRAVVLCFSEPRGELRLRLRLRLRPRSSRVIAFYRDAKEKKENGRSLLLGKLFQDPCGVSHIEEAIFILWKRLSLNKRVKHPQYPLSCKVFEFTVHCLHFLEYKFHLPLPFLFQALITE